MGYFWKQYEDLPDGLGYGRFGTEHITTIIVVGLIILLAAKRFGRQSDHAKKRILAGIPVLMVILECFKDTFLITQGRFGVGYLPLHMCSLGVFVFIFFALSKTDRWKRIWTEIACTLILPGSVAAIIFPDWAHLYPVFNFMNLYGYVWHGLLVMYPILMLKAGHADLSVRHIRYDIIFLLVTVPPVWLFDRRFGCNYMFVDHAPKGTPLSVIESITGSEWYLAGYIVFSMIVILLIYLGIHAYRYLKRRP